MKLTTLCIIHVEFSYYILNIKSGVKWPVNLGHWEYISYNKTSEHGILYIDQ